MSTNISVKEHIVAQGIDTLVIGYSLKGELVPEWAEMLTICKGLAQQPGMQGNFPLELAGIDGVVLAYGSKGYEWIFQNSDISVRIAKEFKSGAVFPEIMVTFRSQYLWRLGAESAVSNIRTWVEKLGGNILYDKVSRVDLCVDLREEVPVMATTDKRIQGKMKLKRDYVGASFANCSHFTGYMMGSGSIISRLYDKEYEINRISNKQWMKDIWKKHGYIEGDPVSRVEFELHREAIIEFLGKQESGFDSLMLAMPDIWKYMTKKWFTLHDKNEKDKRHTRWAISDFWKVVQSATMMFGKLSGVMRFHQVNPKIKHLMSMMQGCLLSASALCGNTNKIFDEVKNMKESLEFAGLLPARQAKLAFCQ